MPPKGRSKRHLERFCERLSSDPSTDTRTPSISSHQGHFPTFRPATTPLHDTTRERHHAIRTRKRSADISLNAIARSPWWKRSIVIAIPCCRWTPTMSLPMVLRAPKMDRNDSIINRKNLKLVLLITLVCVDNLTSRERGRKVGTGTIPSSTPRTILSAPWPADLFILARRTHR